MTMANLYVPGGRVQEPAFRVVNAARAAPTVRDRLIYRGAANPGIPQLTQATLRTHVHRSAYPTHIYIMSIIVLVGTIISLLLGYVIPGPVSGVAFPVFLTLWWLLYRTIRRYDDRKIA